MTAKSYTLSEKQQTDLEKILEEGNRKYACIAHIICENQFDAGTFFEDEDQE